MSSYYDTGKSGHWLVVDEEGPEAGTLPDSSEQHLVQETRHARPNLGEGNRRPQLAGPGLESQQTNGHSVSSAREAAPSSPSKSQRLLERHSQGQSFYKYGAPGSSHSHNEFVRIVSSSLPFDARPQKPSRTINDWICETESLPQVLSLIAAHGCEFDSTNTATAIHRVAKWYREAPDSRLFRDDRWREVLAIMTKNMPSFTPRHISGVLWSFATLHHRGPEWERALEAAQGHLTEFSPVDLALTAWSIATMKMDPLSLYDQISKLAIPKIADFQPQALSNIMWATATLKKENDALIRNAAMVACRHLDAGVDFRPHEYSTMVWSMVLTQAKEECLFDRISRRILPRVTEFGPQELTNTVWAFASLGIRTEGLFEAVGAECHKKLRHFNTQNITNIAWAYTHLKVGGQGMLTDIAKLALSRVGEMNVQDLAQLALSLVFCRRAGGGVHGIGVEDDAGVLGTRELTLALVREVTCAMVGKIRQGGTYPDDAWIVHDLMLIWMDESEAEQLLGPIWSVLDSYMVALYNQVVEFLRGTPLLARALPCGSVVQSAHVGVYEQAFRELDLRSLGIKYTQKLLAELRLLPAPDDSFAAEARALVAAERAAWLLQDPGAGSQTWCVFRYQLSLDEKAAAYGRPKTLPGVQVLPASAEELHGIRIRSCGNDPTALELLDPPREAHFVAVKLSNDRLNHRRRDAEFRAIAHVAGVLRTLVPEADAMMVERAHWGEWLQGWVKMYVTEVPCLSCLGVMVQFSRRFPRVSLSVHFPGGV